jgi:hypothetical protein
MPETLEMRVERLEKLVSTMVPKNEQWVSASVITNNTWWDKEDLRRARRNGSIKWKIKRHGEKNSYIYLLSSIIK